jgi:ADP-ribosylglycohydrolase
MHGPGGFTSQSMQDAWHKRVQQGLPWGSIGGNADNTEAAERKQQEKRYEGLFASPDALLTPSCIARAAHANTIRIEPASQVGLLYGLPCAVYHQFPAAYYLAARFTDDFESAVLHAINGGGQNMARAMLTGALSGAMAGLSGIPQRFIDGLERAAPLLALAEALAGDVQRHVE